MKDLSTKNNAPDRVVTVSELNNFVPIHATDANFERTVGDDGLGNYLFKETITPNSHSIEINDDNGLKNKSEFKNGNFIISTPDAIYPCVIGNTIDPDNEKSFSLFSKVVEEDGSFYIHFQEVYK
jgi:hypothetical protein